MKTNTKAVGSEMYLNLHLKDLLKNKSVSLVSVLFFSLICSEVTVFISFIAPFLHRMELFCLFIKENPIFKIWFSFIWLFDQS